MRNPTVHPTLRDEAERLAATHGAAHVVVIEAGQQTVKRLSRWYPQRRRFGCAQPELVWFAGRGA